MAGGNFGQPTPLLAALVLRRLMLSWGTSATRTLRLQRVTRPRTNSAAAKPSKASRRSVAKSVLIQLQRAVLADLLCFLVVLPLGPLCYRVAEPAITHGCTSCPCSGMMADDRCHAYSGMP